jgi:hypothetical protein
MKGLTIFAILAFATTGALAQVSLSDDDVLKQLYHGYDPAHEIAQWSCTREQQKKGLHSGWQCSAPSEPVSASVVLKTQVAEGDSAMTFVLTSATPQTKGTITATLAPLQLGLPSSNGKVKVGS